MASRLAQGVAIVGSCTTVLDGGSLDDLGREIHLLGDWMNVCLPDACLVVEGGGGALKTVAGSIVPS